MDFNAQPAGEKSFAQFQRGVCPVWPIMIEYNLLHLHLSPTCQLAKIFQSVKRCRILPSPSWADWLERDRAVSVTRSSNQFATRWPSSSQHGVKTTCPPLFYPTLSISSCRPVIRGHTGLVPPFPILLNWPPRTNYFTGIVLPSSLLCPPTPHPLLLAHLSYFCSPFQEHRLWLPQN